MLRKAGVEATDGSDSESDLVAGLTMVVERRRVGAPSHRGTQRGRGVEEKDEKHEKRKRVRRRYVGVKRGDMRQTDSHGKGHVK